MKEKKTLGRRLGEAVRKSATKVNPKAKKGLKAVFRARGMSKKQIRANTKKAVTHARPVPPEERTLMDKVARLANIGSQLRITR